MSVTLPNGSTIAIASGYGASKNMTAVSNAATAVATLEASHGVANTEMIEVNSGWSRLNGKIVRAANLATNNIDLEGIKTTDTSAYPAGGGVGTVREITGFTQILGILGVQSEGGQQQFATFQELEADQEKRIPTSKSASGLTLTVADDPSLAWYALVELANDDRNPRAVRITLANGAKIYYNAYVSLNKTPSLNPNNPMTLQVTLSLLNEPVRYAS